MAEDLLVLALELLRRGEPFALATVVRCERPTSAKPGAKALIRQDGTVSGWVGGACAEPAVVREALNALSDGRPRFIGLVGEVGRGPGRTEGVLEYPMTCHSGGTLEIYVEAFLPKPHLVLLGHGPVVDTLAALGQSAGYAVVVLPAAGVVDGLRGLPLTPRASIIVATHGELDEEALTGALETEAGYVALVASRKRAAAITESLRRGGIPPDHLDRLKAPAGLDIGAVTPEEIAVSVLAEIIQRHRSEKIAWVKTDTGQATAAPRQAKDPICGMVVEIATARYHSEVTGHRVYFCCRGCKEQFDRAPERYLAGLAE